MSATQPLSITNLQAAVSGTSVALSWTNNNAGFEAGAEIYRTIATGEETNFVLLATVPAGQTTYVDNVTHGQTLLYRVTALPFSSGIFTPAAPSNTVDSAYAGSAPHFYAQRLTVDGTGNSSAHLVPVLDGSWTAGGN